MSKAHLFVEDERLPVVDGRRLRGHPAVQGVSDPGKEADRCAEFIRHEGEGDEVKARAAGCDHSVIKPYSPMQPLRLIKGDLGA